MERRERRRTKDCQNDVYVDNQWIDEEEGEYKEETMRERKGRDLSQRICLVVLRLRQATYGTKSTVVGYDGTKIQWEATTVHNRMVEAMTVPKAVNNTMV